MAVSPHRQSSPSEVSLPPSPSSRSAAVVTRPSRVTATPVRGPVLVPVLSPILSPILSLVLGSGLLACNSKPSKPSKTNASNKEAKAKTKAALSAAPKPQPRINRQVYLETLAAVRKSDAVLPPKPKSSAVLGSYNREAIIPPQCYTKTEGRHNPCYVCHQDAIPGRENTMNDADLQAAYTFSDVGTHNHWDNLFEDRSERVNAISDQDILAWVNQDNYSELAPRLKAAGFKAWIPDMKDLHLGAAAFDRQGFAKDGSGWVAFNYKPMPSTFWPTNGSTDDVMIRLPEPFRVDKNGKPSRAVYRANLAILEARIKGLEKVSVDPIDERKVATDLDGDGKLGTATFITQVDGFIGGAHDYYSLRGLYPKDTEFMHSVRYLGINKDGSIGVSRRMKELRYMRKAGMMTRAQIAEKYREEGYSKDAGYLPGYVPVGHWGLDNGMGWAIMGFIESPSGKLRFNTYEENFSCMGCHTSVGATIDKTFSFARKVEGAKGWGYINLKGMPDAPNVGESKGEIATYLERVGGGGEFRSNPEMQARFFNAKGEADAKKIAAVPDVYGLITPSKKRALMLNKAYRVIVEDQDFIYGKDATVTPPVNVYRDVDPEKAPVLPKEVQYKWDIRLDWSGYSNKGNKAGKNTSARKKRKKGKKRGSSKAQL